MPSNPNGCMASAPLLNPMSCSRLANWPSGFVLTFTVRTKLILLFPRKCLEDALGEEQRKNGERLSRRQMISLLMSVVAAAFGLTRTSNAPLLHKDEVLSLCTAHVPLAWQLYFAGGIQEVTQTLPDYLTQLSTLAQAPSKYQLTAANLAAQAYQ